MNYIFRPSSSPKYGGGHVSRCLSLANILKESSDVSFVLDNDGQHWFDCLIKSDFSCEYIEKISLEKTNCDVCILDGYHFNNNEVSLWRKVSKYIVVIDDLYRSHTYADVIVNLSLPDDLEQLDGIPLYSKMKYAILDGVYNLKSNDKIITKEVNDILIIFGYIDSKGATLYTLKVLEKLYKYNPNIKVNVIIGSECPTINSIKKFSSKNTFEFQLMINSKNVIDSLLSADLVIGAGGVGLLERVSLGIPSITLSTSENQEGQLGKISNQGGSIPLSFDKIRRDDLFFTIKNTIDDYELRKNMSINSRKIIDGLGAKRVASLITALK